MSARFEELDWQPTAMGELVLRRRRTPSSDVDIYEVKLGDEFLMSSMFTVAEVEMARLALREVSGADLDVLVGGLGLGYTARAVLEDPRVGRLTVIEALGEVIDWHRRGLVPAATSESTDARCALTHGDLFAMLRAPGDPFDGRLFDAMVVDIDHSPRHVLDPSHADFYEPAGVARLAARLRPGGVFALWSNDPPDEAFTAVLAEVFATAVAEAVRFPNPLQGREATNTVYVATTAPLAR
ncbi:spermidine synthase [Actinomycetospora sp. CA-101289]|uniref:spermine/spermidine synthase domain-containing protein n=1 Tax=Actinomycetospora sp. CA-101289 TaxID=3239893 RepID=UPI003D968321